MMPGLDDGVGRNRGWLVAVLSVLLERGLNQNRSWLGRLVKLAPARTVRPDARSTPVLAGVAVRAPAEVRVALGCTQYTRRKQNGGEDPRHDAVRSNRE